VPVLHFFTGLHGDYHRPSDDFDKLNLDGMRRIAGMVANAVVELANAETKPTWSNSMQSLLADVSPDLSSGGEAQPFLGIMQDAQHPGSGYAILRIVGGGPADRAGLRPGDVILQFADQPIEAAATLQAAIAGSTPGTKVKLKCRRGQVDIELEVEIGKRSG
jgi:S1-C subfamily serine protease